MKKIGFLSFSLLVHTFFNVSNVHFVCRLLLQKEHKKTLKTHRYWMMMFEAAEETRTVADHELTCDCDLPSRPTRRQQTRRS
jgi:hypothetical protein